MSGLFLAPPGIQDYHIRNAFKGDVRTKVEADATKFGEYYENLFHLAHRDPSNRHCMCFSCKTHAYNAITHGYADPTNTDTPHPAAGWHLYDEHNQARIGFGRDDGNRCV